MAYIAGLVFYIGRCVDFPGAVGKFDLAVFIINPDRFDGFMPADIIDNLIDIIAGVRHHGIVSAEFDGRAQTVGSDHHMFHEFFFLVIDVKISPGGQGDEQRQSHRKDEFGS